MFFFLFLNSRSAVIGGFVSLNCWVERLIQQLCFRVLLPLERRTELLFHIDLPKAEAQGTQGLIVGPSGARSLWSV